MVTDAGGPVPGQLLPSIQAAKITQSISDYLKTTFALSDASVAHTLDEFLTDPERGIFKGPYTRVRLPFRPADDGWRDSLGWYPEQFSPYGHQATAFDRLSSANLSDEKPRPLPTLVTTGTGSGKTEAFLYPILDHVLRTQQRGEGGVKALILYPMNALANDQADRLKRMIMEQPALGGVRAALYTGEASASDGRRKVTDDGLITSRQEMREHAPDILLTNYKMLDQLLLRADDHDLWKQSASSLQYLVLDEFHTYDGAQGTDVAMLLRRLGLVLARYRGEATPERPLGNVTPVATSATLGDKGDPDAMIEFAHTVFGEPVDASSVVTETRLTFDEWSDGALDRVAPLGLRSRAADPRMVDDLANIIEETESATEIARNVLRVLWGDSLSDDGAKIDDAVVDEYGLDLVRAHPVVQTLVTHATDAIVIDKLTSALFFAGLGIDERFDERRAKRRAALAALLAMLSHVRTVFGREAPSIDVHLWLRELTRVDRVAHPDPQFIWGDDGHIEADDETGYAPTVFPAVYCRNCGRSGWGVVLAPTGNDLQPDDVNVRTEHLNKSGRFRALLHASQEDAKRVDDGVEIEGLRWLHARQRRLVGEAPDAFTHADDYERGEILPVLTLVGRDADDESNDDTCPSCERTDSIRFMGSAMATMLSVAVTTIFGDGALESGEKKALVFTDSVQDAAHRAGFVQSRAHSFTLRNAIRRAVGSDVVALDELATRMLDDARNDAQDRYKLLAPELAERDDFASFWNGNEGRPVPQAVRKRVRDRLLFDASLEVGLHSRVGRTLELTGSVVAEVDAGAPAALARIARGVLEPYFAKQLDGLVDVPSDEDLVRWARGVVERLRERGGIHHAWLNSYLKHDGRRWYVWGGRPRSQGMPAFPPGREAPAFARVGPAVTGVAPGQRSLLDQAASSQSWYATWARDVLGIPSQHADRVARDLFDALEDQGVLTAVTSERAAKIYGIPAERIVLHPVSDEALERGDNMLECDTCHAPVPGAASSVSQLAGGPCMSARCAGVLGRITQGTNFYRDLYGEGDMRRVVAREHSGILDKDVRLGYEDGFKQTAERPDAPNVLVATPTLEMGIDIGDLSAVMLAGLPKSVASYQQRVGRAGRLTGSALSLAFVSGRGDQLPKLGDPLSVIDGDVVPPATYLNAEEILQRQYLASLIDRFAIATPQRPTLAESVLWTAEAGSFLGEMLAFADVHRADHLEAFLAQYGDQLSVSAADALREWVTPSETSVSGLQSFVVGAVQRWNAELEELRVRGKRIDAALEELERRAQHTAATDEDKNELRTATSAYKHVKKLRMEIRKEHWVSALERMGVLPNYTLLDDRVQLDVSVTWMDPESSEYEQKPYVYDRGASAALVEFAPGSTFYAQGMQIEIDSIDLGPNQTEARDWRFCPACGFGEILERGAQLAATCPRCGAPGISDVDQRMTVVELNRVSAEVRRDEATISDRDDSRRRQRYTSVVAADFDPAKRAGDPWFVGSVGLGVSAYRNMTIRWLNLGRSTAAGQARLLAGEELRSPLFRVCKECGHLDRNAAQNSRNEHRAWCSQRNAESDPALTIALSRTLTTQSVALRLPPAVTLGDSLALPSLRAALLRGLRQVMGGDPDHLRIESVAQPQFSDGTENSFALLVHDVVPGGTGYLAELSNPDRIRELLIAAWKVVRDCACRAPDGLEQRAACHRCLLPFTFGDADSVSRAAAQHVLEILLDVTDGEPSEWDVTTEDPGVELGESVIEQRFRKVFIERAEAAGASVKEIPGDAGNKVQATFAGSGRQWVLSPQVNIGPTKPDFILEQFGGGAKPIAIYTDGFAFHASLANNNLADDAAKRRALRDLGYHVVAVTWADLEAAESKEPAPTPWWYDAGAATQLLGRFHVRPVAVDFMLADPVTQLISCMQQPDSVDADWQRIAAAVPWLLTRSRAFVERGESRIETLARQRITGETASPTQHKIAWTVGREDLALAVVRLTPSGLETELAMLLDDRPLALERDGFGEAWRSWLRLSNLLSASDSRRAIIRTMTELEAEITGEQQTAPATGLSSAWSELVDQATSAERQVLIELAASGLTRPEMGIEVSGIPVSFAWAEERVAVLLDPESGDEDELTKAGWTVTGGDAESVRAALVA